MPHRNPVNTPIEVEPGTLYGRPVWVASGPMPDAIPIDATCNIVDVIDRTFYATWAQPHTATHTTRPPRRTQRRPAPARARLVQVPAVARPERKHRVLALAGLALAATSVGTLAAGIEFGGHGGVPAASAATPFSDPTWRMMAVEDGWQCTSEATQLQQCKGNTGVTARAEEYDGPDSKMFVLTYDSGGGTQRDVLRVYTTPAGITGVVKAAQADPDAYPNLRTGPGWVMTSTDPDLEPLDTNGTASPTPSPTPTATASPTPTPTPSATATHRTQWGYGDVGGVVRHAVGGRVAQSVGGRAPATPRIPGATVHTQPMAKGPTAVVIVVPGRAVPLSPSPSATVTATVTASPTPSAPVTPFAPVTPVPTPSATVTPDPTPDVTATPAPLAATS